MAKQMAMSLQVRRARPFVATGVAIATAGILVAVPAATAPPLTGRDVRVAADVQTALSARKDLANSAPSFAANPALLPWLQLAANVRADSGAEGAQRVASTATPPQPGVAAPALTDSPDEATIREAISAALLAFTDGGPVGALIAALNVFVLDQGNTVLSAALLAFQAGGPVGALLAGLAEAINPTTEDSAATASAASPEPSTKDEVISAALLAFTDGGPVGAFIAGLNVLIQDKDPALSAALLAFQGGGPVGAVLAGLAEKINPTMTTDSAQGTTMALAAQPEASTPIDGVGGLFGQNARRPSVGLFTPPQADEPKLSARATGPDTGSAPEDFGSAFKSVAPEAPVFKVPDAPKAPVSKAPVFKAPKAPATEVLKETDAVTTGDGEGNGLVRNSPKFTPPDVILPDGSKSGAGAGGAWNPFQGIKDAMDRFSGGGDATKAPANATDGDTGGGGLNR